MPPFSEPVAEPVGCPFVLGGKRPAPGPVVLPPGVGGGPPGFCAHMTGTDMAIPIANPAKLCTRMLIRMGEPPFVSHIIHVERALRKTSWPFTFSGGASQGLLEYGFSGWSHENVHTLLRRCPAPVAGRVFD